jgi:glutathione peroxidase
MAIYDHDIHRLDGSDADLHDYEGQVALVVNVASNCGFTPQYEGLQKLYDQYRERGFTVLGFPCNQFLEQEPGTPEEIASFCSVNYGVTFPIFEKIEVNGEARHAVYADLTQTADADGNAGDIGWNFEKFLVGPQGQVIGRYRTGVEPEDPQIVGAIEANLPR